MKSDWELPGCFIRKFVVSTGQIKIKLSNLEGFQLKQHCIMHGAKV